MRCGTPVPAVGRVQGPSPESRRQVAELRQVTTPKYGPQRLDPEPDVRLVSHGKAAGSGPGYVRTQCCSRCALCQGCG